MGVLPFAQNDVPFIITNSGRLSEHAATLLYESCRLVEPRGELRVLELGAGCGLFARLFLDAFKAICEQQHTCYYERLRYVVSDGSPESVRQWHERGLFEEHAGRVMAIQCNARFPETGERLEPGTHRLVICNYVLDVLPSTTIRRTAEGFDELVVRTHLVADQEILAQHTALPTGEIRALANARDPEQRRKLFPLLSLFELETDFRPLSAALRPYADRLITECDIGERMLLNFGAYDAIESSLQLLEQGGYMLISDYGPSDRESQAAHTGSQRFGPTLAHGINFPLLGKLVRSPWTVHVPDNDAAVPLHTRLIARDGNKDLVSAFNNRFGSEGQAYFEDPLSEGRDHALAGRNDQALDAYRVALTRNRRDWFVLTEIAEYVGLQLRDAAAGIELAQEAVRQNPWYSPWAWNVLGDCLFCQKRVSDAHEAYLQAQRIDPRDPRTNLNLAYTQTEFCEYEEALCAIGRGLAHDTGGLYREQLLEKQRQILGVVSVRTFGERDRSMRRSLSQS